MKNVSKYLFAVSGLLLCAGLVQAADEECDSVKHRQSKSEECDSVKHRQSKSEECDSVKHRHSKSEECNSVKHRQSKFNKGMKFDSMDANSDGGISISEFNEHSSRRFKKLDANSDGKITSEELQGNHGKKASRRGTTHLDKRFYSADANHDGGLDKAEANSMPMLTTYFGQVDSDNDGKVTRQEYFDAMPLLHRAKQIDTSGKSQAL